MSLATAVPRVRVEQSDIIGLCDRAFDRASSEIDRLRPTFANAGIAGRYFCMPLDWYLARHGWRERSQLYVSHSVDLLEEVAIRCLEQSGLGIDDIDGIVSVSTTGIATPSLDALLIERLRAPRHMRRLPLFGLGCVGGVVGMSRAAEMAAVAPGRRILLLVVELCSLTFRFGDNSNSNIIAAALFGDGAAGALIGCDGDGPELLHGGEHTWANSLDVMGWNIEEDGLGVVFSRDIPTIVRRDLRTAAENFLGRHGLILRSLAGFICHPGGAKVMDAMEQVFELPPGSLGEAREVLRDHGNMSAVTVLFVLERMLRKAPRGQYLMSALGPGFTAGFHVMRLS
ncbi:MAG: type III polyketide synthase [Dongiaceae bacterium]